MHSTDTVQRLAWALVVLVAAAGSATAQGASQAELMRAVESGNLTAVRRLVQMKTDVNAPAADGSTALHVAVRNDMAPVVDVLLAAGADAQAVTRYGVTPLGLAALNGSATIAEALLKAGADANTKSKAGEPVLMTAARTGDVKTIKTLLGYGARVDEPEAWMGQTALMWAATENHPDAVRALLEAGADINLRAKALEGQPKRAADPEVAFQVPHTNFPKGTSTALMLAARQGSLAAVKVLVEAKADLNVADPDGITALLLALMNAHYDEAAVLIENGADVNQVDRSGRGPLYMAAEAHRMEWLFSRPSPRPTGQLDAPDVIRMLLARGAAVDAPLKGRAMLLHHEATGNANLVGGSTPLMKAATTSDVELIQMLLAAGANPNAVNQQKTTPLMAAAGLNWKGIASIGTEEESIEVLKLLIARGADVNATNTLGETAMHGAAQRGADKVIQFLADQGAAIDPVNSAGRTPFDEAQGQFSASADSAGVRRPSHPTTEALLLKLRNGQQAAGSRQ
jgi:ankyrin repeat protein